MLKKTLHQIHLWMGLLSGIFVFILGITGCILAFVDELKPVVYQDHYFVPEVTGHEVTFTKLLESAQQYWGADKPVSAVEIENNPKMTWHFRAYKEDTNDGIWYWNEKKYYESLFINPYNGTREYAENAEFEFFRVVLWLHWSLLLKSDIGQPITGVATLLFVILLFTGLYLWWPKNKKARRVRFSFRWKKETGIKRKNYDLHNILGFYSITIAFIIALTGLIWAFPWFDQSVQNFLNAVGNQQKVEQTLPSKNLEHNTVETTAHLGVYDQILLQARKEYPNALGYHFYFPRDERALLTVLIRAPKTYNSIALQYNANNGQLLNKSDFAGKDNGQKMRALNYDIHLGSILGIPGKIIVFFASLIAASLPVTGFYIWYNRNYKKKKPQHSSSL